jgi:hypothetical protein
MIGELEVKLALLQPKIDKSEVGSERQLMLLDLKKDLEARLRAERGDTVKLHVADEGICESCQ